MTKSLTRFGTILILLIGMTLMIGAFSGIAHAQTSATQSTGCPGGTCPTGQSCYQVASGGQSSKRCLTPSQVSGYNGPATAPGSDTAGSGGTLINPLKVDSIEGLLGLVVDAAIQLGTIVLVLALVYVGFLFVVARGNEEKIRDARRYFFWIVIGGLLVLGAKGLSEVIKSTANTLGS